MLGNSVVVVRTRPRAIPLAMISMRKSTRGFPFLSYMSMRLRLAALRAAELRYKSTKVLSRMPFSDRVFLSRNYRLIAAPRKLMF